MIFIFEESKDFRGSGDDGLGESGKGGDVYAVGSVACSVDDVMEEDDLSFVFFDFHGVVRNEG